MKHFTLATLRATCIVTFILSSAGCSFQMFGNNDCKIGFEENPQQYMTQSEDHYQDLTNFQEDKPEEDGLEEGNPEETDPQERYVYLDLKEFQFNHSVSGHWPPLYRWAQEKWGSPGSELQIIIIAYTYENASDYRYLQAMFRRLYRIDRERLKKGHNFLHPWFNLDLLPEGCVGGFWMGYVDEIRTEQSRGTTGLIVPLNNIVAHPSSHSNAGRFWPIPLDVSEGRNLYLKIVVLEETGSTIVRKLDDGIEERSGREIAVEVFKAASGSDYLAIAEVIGEAIVNEGVDAYLDRTSPIDIEYVYESPDPARPASRGPLALPCLHQRRWVDGKDGFDSWLDISLQLRLEVSSAWPVPPTLPVEGNGQNGSERRFCPLPFRHD